MAKFKSKSRSKLFRKSSPYRKVLIFFVFLLAAAGVLGGFWFLSNMGPRKVDYRDLRTMEEISEESKKLEAQSLELESQFQDILALREPEPEDLELIRRARDLQKEYIDSVGFVDSDTSARLQYLDERYQNLASKRLYEDSLSLEAEAERLARDNDYEAARARYREAYRLQNQINERFPLSAAQNVGRASRIERQIRYLTAEPLLQQSLALQSEAEDFVAEEDWEEAESKLQQAIRMQDQLNRDYRGTNQASVARLERLRTQLLGVRSGQSHLDVEAVAKRADASRAAGDNLEAARQYREAARLQRQLNESFVGSPYASSERVAEFQRKAETAQSFELGVSIEQNHDLLRQLLSERRAYEAAEVIVTLRRDIKQMREAFPRSSLNDEELELKVRYLNLVQSDLGFIQDRVYDALLPIPGKEAWRMLRTEVPQALYTVIMGTNPSRNRSDVNPVDSVSWIEAKNFCERLSWIMGKPVRLPTEDEFRASLGRLRYVVLEEHVWSASNSNGVAQPVGEKSPFDSGCYDLLGNVSEWLESTDRFENENARHIGGHAQDRLEVIFTVPVREAPRGERNRMTGFRVVMETN
jgi:hypothetical protein